MKKLLQEIVNSYEDTGCDGCGTISERVIEKVRQALRDYKPCDHNKVIEKHYRFLEALVDIAFLAGAKRFSSGDSREDIGTVIEWAREFENTYKDRKWDGSAGNDYMIAIEEFAFNKIIESGHAKPIRVMLNISGGNLQSITATHEMSIHVVDWDNINAGDELTDDPSGPDEVVDDDKFDEYLQDAIKEAKKKQACE